MPRKITDFKQLKKKLGRSPWVEPGRVRSRLQVEAQLAPGASPAAVGECRAVALEWAERRLGRRLPWRARRHRPFAARTEGVSVRSARFRDGRGDGWAVRLEHAAEPDQRATIDFSVARDDADIPSVAVTVQDHSALPMVWDHYPAGALATMTERAPLAQGGLPLLHAPILVESEAEVNALAGRLVDPNRELPFVAISIPPDDSESASVASSWDALARSLTGLAVVWVLPTAMTYRLSDAVGRDLSVYLGAWRFYRPGFRPGASKADHPLTLGKHLAHDGVAARVSRDFLRMAAEERMRTASTDDGPLDYDAVAQKSRSAAGGAARLVSFLRRFGRDEPSEPAAPEPDREPAETPEPAPASNLRRKLAVARKAARASGKRYRQEKKRADRAEREREEALARAERLAGLARALGGDPDARVPFPISWDEFADWCAESLSGRVALADAAKRELRKAEFEDVGLAARCLSWLAGEYRDGRLRGGDPHLRGPISGVGGGVHNEPCGSDAFECTWQGGARTVDWHVKHANTHDPRRCLRIYYFWDDRTRQAVVASMPAHR